MGPRAPRLLRSCLAVEIPFGTPQTSTKFLQKLFLAEVCLAPLLGREVCRQKCPEKPVFGLSLDLLRGSILLLTRVRTCPASRPQGPKTSQQSRKRDKNGPLLSSSKTKNSLEIDWIAERQRGNGKRGSGPKVLFQRLLGEGLSYSKWPRKCWEVAENGSNSFLSPFALLQQNAPIAPKKRPVRGNFCCLKGGGWGSLVIWKGSNQPRKGKS